jgi:oligopeptide transport system substrate-binding protein
MEKNFPTVKCFTTPCKATRPSPKPFRKCGSKNLNINVTLHNEEWKVYLDADAHDQLRHSPGRVDGDYVDPSTFLDVFLTDSGNNETGWSNAEYDRLAAWHPTLGDRPPVSQRIKKLRPFCG